MSLRDKIDPIRVMAYFWGALFAAVMIWIFYQEFLSLDFCG
jgi:hypothetical protein